jgi:hypothetical protein
MTDSPELSTRDLAARLSGKSSGRDFASALRQVQHWTELDHLETLGSKNTGTGRSRLYGRNELFKAIILRELVRIGVQVAELESFGDFLNGAIRLNVKVWQQVTQGTGEAFLQAYFGPDGAMSWTIEGEQPSLKLLVRPQTGKTAMSKEFTSTVVLNLKRLFEGYQL